MASSYLVYADESGQREYGPKTDPYFVVAGVLLDATEAPHLEDEVRGLKRTFWGAPDAELKSNWIRQPHERDKHYTVPLGVGVKEIDELLTALYRWLHRVPVTVLAGVVDKPLMKLRYTAPHYAGGVAYTMMLQRYQKYLSKHSATGSVIFDDPSGKSPGGFAWRDLLQKQHSSLKKSGCPYTHTEFPDVGALSFTNSAHSPFVQIADLVAYNIFRQFRDHGSVYDEPSAKSLPLYEHFAKVVRLFDLGPNRVFAGYGLAKWPVSFKNRWAAPA